jgi:hypothetical protein
MVGPHAVIPAKAGISILQRTEEKRDSSFRWNDDQVWIEAI